MWQLKFLKLKKKKENIESYYHKFIIYYLFVSNYLIKSWFKTKIYEYKLFVFYAQTFLKS